MYKAFNLFEAPGSMWIKRHMRHYAYRDQFNDETTLASQSYTIGTNARAVNNRNWPMIDDTRLTGEIPAGTCYGREIKLLCTEDAYFTFVCLNPRYGNRFNNYLLKERTPAQAAELLVLDGILEHITEVEMFLPADDEMTFFPIWLTSIDYRWSAVEGTLYAWIEGNVEGQD